MPWACGFILFSFYVLQALFILTTVKNMKYWRGRLLKVCNIYHMGGATTVVGMKS